MFFVSEKKNKKQISHPRQLTPLPSSPLPTFLYLSKLSIGEYVAVEKIEYQIASRLPIALQFFIHGDSHEPCLVSIFVPDPETFPAFANNVLFPSGAGGLTGKIDDAFRTACQDTKLRRAVLQEVTLVAQAAGLKK